MYFDTDNTLVALSSDGPKEFEIKFVLEHGQALRLLELGLLDKTAFGRAQKIQTVYFDTPDGHLFQAGMTLRWRKLGNRKPVITLKMASHGGASIFERTEIEIPASPEGINLDLFDRAIADHIRNAIEGNTLVARYETNFRRKAALIKMPLSAFEIALDEGAFLVAGREWPLNELEIELKSGDWLEMVSLARDLVTKASLRLEMVSKSERCLILAGLRPKQRKPAQSLVAEGMSLDTAMVIVLAEGLQHFIDHLQPFRDNADPRAVHQMRVGLRRLRAALKVFARAFPQASFAHYAARARELANGLALARECDAFRDLAFGYPLAHANAPADKRDLDESLKVLRETAYADAEQVINSAETSLFIIDLQSYIAKRGWRSEIGDEQLSALTLPAAEFAKATLDRLFKKAKKQGKALLEKTDEERHEFRITLKNLRYNAQFFTALFDHPKLYKAWNNALVQLQNSLGIHNDLSGAAAMLARLRILDQDNFAQASGFVMGWYACQNEAADAKIEKQWRKVRNLPRFWA